MSLSLKNINFSSPIYFITGNTFKRINIFQHNPFFCKFFIDNIYFYCNKYSIDLASGVLMPEHYHYLFQFINEEILDNRENIIINFLRDFKSYTAKQVINYIKKNLAQNYFISCCQKIISDDEYKKLLSQVEKNYHPFLKQALIDPDVYQYHYEAYLLDLDLLISESNKLLPKRIVSKKLEHKIIKINNSNNSRDLIFKVTSQELLDLLKIKNGHKVFQRQDYVKVIQNEKSYNGILGYICNNPIKRGLIGNDSEYIWMFGKQK